MTWQINQQVGVVRSGEPNYYTRKDGSSIPKRPEEVYPGEILELLPKSAKVRIDLRGRPHIKTVLLTHLREKPVAAAT